MKITEPSAVILEPELAGLSVCQRIDRCASVEANHGAAARAVPGGIS